MTETIIHPSSLSGYLLVATPNLTDSIFAQSVIYICAHSVDGGAIGLIINKKLDHNVTEEITKQLHLMDSHSLSTIPITLGGPVETGRGLLLHSTEWDNKNSMPITPSISLSTSITILKDILSSKTPQKALLALGHSSWESGQLEEELKHNAWLPIKADDDIVFGKNYAQKWRKALLTLHIQPEHLTTFYGHA
ncbi:YqgE/AlgH family protein [Entomobacter blattae]|uniref:UPF0301 protein JGUZn3_18960 n=1 Tax=Entomobacter blattae TaxID=2762277 RepID=A0A7H1NTK0_9PROT|nr:YqgE/AlgH family protein [Entomobacter blattae]QNT79110.1 hypothetical protein JGUZn3_18960 [Entomobacter blattae]